MQVSAELRWFWKDSAPPGLEAWFRSGPFSPGGGLPRQDEYLLDPRQIELGFKTRGGKRGVEVKGLVGVRPPDAGLAPFAGTIQIWSKWTSEAMRLEGLPTLALTKTRWLRKFDGGWQEVQEVELNEKESPKKPTDSLPDQGCNVEFTQVSVDRSTRTWWTLGFEAFGQLETVEVDLRRTIGHLVKTNLLTLDRGLELSYPAWLRSHAVERTAI